MEYVVEGSGQVLAILRTNEGKSLLYLLPCQLPRARTTVVILPLVVLKAELERRCNDAGIEAHDWKTESDPEKLHSCPLIMVAVEQAVGQSFQAFLTRLDAANGLDRVVFDECHLAITAASYRGAMQLLPKLRQLAVQTVFLTGTMPPSMVPQFEKKMLLRGARMVRSPTMRRDISFQVSQCAPEIPFVRDFSVPRIQEVIRGLAGNTRAIFYCNSKAVVNEIAQAIGAPMYYSTSGSVEEKAKVLEQWRAGNPAYIVATSAFGMGIDYPEVRSVVHVGAPSSAIDFAQEVGRLGRDGKGGESIVLIPSSWKATTTDRNARPLESAEAAMQNFLSTSSCRVLELSQYLDGDDGSACALESPMCDQCQCVTAPSIEHGYVSA
jgi:superfamily II DNA helicase RecQ